MRTNAVSACGVPFTDALFVIWIFFAIRVRAWADAIFATENIITNFVSTVLAVGEGEMISERCLVLRFDLQALRVVFALILVDILCVVEVDKFRLREEFDMIARREIN